jgi:hypothetical protein
MTCGLSPTSAFLFLADPHLGSLEMSRQLPATQQDTFPLLDQMQAWQPFLAGDSVRITCGSLVDATGTILRIAADERCIITIDGVGPGVLVVVSAASLEKVDRTARRCTAASGPATNGD